MSLASMVSTVGVTLLLGAYWAASTGRLQRGQVFHALNFLGAAVAAVGSALIPFVPFIVLELCWAVVALRDLIRERRHHAIAE
jgi:hypothetical protein